MQTLSGKKSVLWNKKSFMMKCFIYLIVIRIHHLTNMTRELEDPMLEYRLTKIWVIKRRFMS